MRRETLDALIAAERAARPVVLASALAGGDEWLITPTEAPADAPSAVVEAARQALADDQSRTIEGEDGAVFLHVHAPRWRMLVVGAVHISQPLAQMAALAGYAVTIIDPRGAFATAERFPGVSVSDEWPDDALERLVPDKRTAVVTLTHDPKLDDAALVICSSSAVR